MGQDGSLWHPYSLYPWNRHFTFYINKEYPLRKKRANELDETDPKVQF
jgi:hypothetical protein